MDVELVVEVVGWGLVLDVEVALSHEGLVLGSLTGVKGVGV